jgi:hypothetical protein
MAHVQQCAVAFMRARVRLFAAVVLCRMRSLFAAVMSCRVCLLSSQHLLCPALPHSQLLLLLRCCVCLQLRMAGRLMPQLGHHDLPPLLAAAARLPLVRVSKPWCVTAMTRAHHTMHLLTPNSIATLTWALGKLGVKFRADFQVKLLQEFKAKLHSAGPRALGVMAHGLAAAGARPDGLWVGVYLQRVQVELRWFSGRDLAMCLYGLVQLR